MIDQLYNKKFDAGYKGKDLGVPDKTKGRTIDAICNADKAKQDYVVTGIENTGRHYQKNLGNAGGDNANFSVAELEKSQGKYQTALGLLGKVTGKLNETYDLAYGEAASEIKKTNANNVAETVSKVQVDVNRALTDAMKTVHKEIGTQATSINEPAAAQLKTVWDIIGKAGKPMADALTDFSIHLGDDLKNTFKDLGNQAVLASNGIVLDGMALNYYTFNNYEIGRASCRERV